MPYRITKVEIHGTSMRCFISSVNRCSRWSEAFFSESWLASLTQWQSVCRHISKWWPRLINEHINELCRLKSNVYRCLSDLVARILHKELHKLVGLVCLEFTNALFLLLTIQIVVRSCQLLDMIDITFLSHKSGERGIGEENEREGVYILYSNHLQAIQEKNSNVKHSMCFCGSLVAIG